MPKVTYKAPPGDAESVTWRGKTFKNGEGVDIDDPAMLAKAQGNPYFEVAGGDKKGEQQQAPVLGNYQDAYTGQTFDLIKKPAPPTYGAGGSGPADIAKPSSATQGSVAVEASRSVTTAPGENPAFEEIYGAKQSEVATGEYEGAPEYKGPEGTVGSGKPRGRPPGSPNKK
jgi:hypothetical protein